MGVNIADAQSLLIQVAQTMTRKDDKEDQPSGGETTWTKYWSDTIWQRTVQDRVIWRRHAEAFAQPRDTTAAQ